RGPALAVDVLDDPGGQCPQLTGYGVPGQVGLVRLLAPVRPRGPRRGVDRTGVGTTAEAVVPRPHRGPDRVREQPRVRLGELAHGSDAERGQPLADLRADPPQGGRR